MGGVESYILACTWKHNKFDNLFQLDIAGNSQAVGSYKGAIHSLILQNSQQNIAPAREDYVEGKMWKL